MSLDIDAIEARAEADHLRRSDIPALIAEIRSLRAALTEAKSSDVVEALAEHTNWELSHFHDDDEFGWQVHEVSGNVNDRIWTKLSTGDTPEEAIRRARASLVAEIDAALSDARKTGDHVGDTDMVAPGYKLVPIEPTEHMLDIGACFEPKSDRDEGALAEDIYRAMLNAAPSTGSRET